MDKKIKRVLSIVLSVAILISSVIFINVVSVAATESIVWGDVDNSGNVDILDVNMLLQYTLRPEKVTGFHADVADVNCDGIIDSTDVANVLQKVGDDSYLMPVQTPATIYIVGDSTSCHYDETADLTYYYKRVGFGDKISDYINADVVNLALSGRSSKSFTTEANYQTLINNIDVGDYLFIAFGHNDEKIEDAARGTTPGGSKEDEGTFKNSLYVNYIKPALDRGATPILVTPIVRRTALATWTDSQIHKVNDGDYAQDIIDLGTELGLTVVNTTSLTKNLYDELTPDETIYLHAWTSSSAVNVDNTHLNNYGAKYVAYLIAESIKASDSTLAPYVNVDNVAPTKADLIINPDYVELSDDEPTDLTSKLWSTTSPWYGSVFGDIGGLSKLQLQITNEYGDTITYDDRLAINPSTGNSYFNIEENADGTVHIRAGELKDDMMTPATSVGKISSTTDGMAMYYLPVSAESNFEISGTITVNGVAKQNQVAFGAIVSDNMRVDTYNAESYTYVAASPLRLARVGGTDTYANGTYARIDGTLQYGPEAITEDITPGTQVKVSIKKVGNVFTATYGDITNTYTVDMTGTVYAGFYAARCADITVSNITYNNEVVEYNLTREYNIIGELSDALSSPETFSAKEVTITPSYKMMGDDLIVDYNIIGENTQFNNYTMFFTFDPSVLTPVSVADGDISIQGIDATGAQISIPASNAVNIEKQFTDIPSAGNADYAGADGVKTQAGLGKVKVAYCIYDKDFSQYPGGALPAFTQEGKLFTVIYKIIGDINGTTLSTAVKELNAVSSDVSVALSSNVSSGSVTVVYEETTETTTETPTIGIDGDIAKYPVSGGYMYFNISTGEITDCDTTVTNVVIPETILDVPVVRIGYGAFNGCTALAEITIPDTVESIGNYAFYNCGLSTVYCHKDAFADDTMLYPPDTVIKYIDYTPEKLFSLSPKKVEINATNDGWSVIKENDSFYAVSTNKTDSSSSTLTMTIEGPCLLYYEMAVSSEEGTDTLVMRNNGAKVKVMSGTDTYTPDNPYIGCIVLGEGENVITYKYSKDDAGTDGEDCAWLKNLRVADLGDDNLDGKVDISDVVLGMKYTENNTALTDILAAKAADYNCDGTVDKADMAAILREMIKNIA